MFATQDEKVTRLFYRVGTSKRNTERFIELDFELVQDPTYGEEVFVRPRPVSSVATIGTNEEPSTLDQSEKPRIVKFEFVSGRPFGDVFHIYDSGSDL